MAEYHFTGYAACVDPYYYSSDDPIDITVYAHGYSEALSKAEKLLGCKIHRRTLRCVIKEELSGPNCGAKMEGDEDDR